MIAQNLMATDDLCIVLTDALLIHAAREYKLVVLGETLRLAACSDVELTDTFREATLFLLRQQVASGPIGAHFVIAANRRSPEALLVTARLAETLDLIAERIAGEVERHGQDGDATSRPVP